MKRITIIIASLSALLILSGCPYESLVPISEPAEKIDTLLFGTWEKRSNRNEIYIVSKKDEFVYNILHHNLDLHTSSQLLAFTSKIGDHTFINIWEPDSVPILYKLYRLETDFSGLMSLREISDSTIKKFTSSSELKHFIKTNMEREGFFGFENVFINHGRIMEIQNEAKLKKAELEKSQTVSYVLTISLILLGAFLIVLVLYARNRRRHDRIVYEQEISALLKEHELKSMSAIIEGQDNERRRIAADLHDRLGSMLATVKLYFTSFDDQIEKLRLQNKQQYSKASQLLDEACDEVRKISHDLASVELTSFGIKASLERLSESIAQAGGPKIAIHSFGLETRLDVVIEIGVYRVLQELVNNILKHSGAKAASIQLNNYANSLNIVVEDDGKGFEILSSGKGIGLKNVKERIDKLNGKVVIDSRKGHGTTIIIDIPIKVIIT